MADRSTLHIALKLFVGLVAIVAVSYGVDWLLRVQNYPVHNVRFEGPFRHVAREELENAVLPLVRGNFFLVDLETIKQRVESIPWVHRASVRRRFPSDVHVQFSEQELAAHWGTADWVNASGDVVRVHGEGLPLDAPRFDGPEGSARRALIAYRDFTPVLAPLGLRIAALRLTPRHGWRLEIERALAAGQLGEKRFVLILDHDEPQRRIERFAQVYRANLMHEAALLKRVDLRYTNGFSVEWWGARDGLRAAAAALTAAGRGNEG